MIGLKYKAYSLDGTWEMAYKEEKYTGKECPWGNAKLNLSEFSGIVRSTVPGYWEDMTESFSKAPFFSHLRINPQYGIQRYPIFGDPPDMALPNISGNFFYRRTFFYDAKKLPAVIHFEGVQNSVSLWINGEYITRHEGYSTPFDIRLPEGVLKEGENTIELSVSNHRLSGYAEEPVSGLTSRAANECTGGITGSVELRAYMGALRDVALFVSDDCEKITAEIFVEGESSFAWSVCDGEKVIKSGKTTEKSFCFDTADLARWSPEKPKLYTLCINDGKASLQHVFGVRRLLADGTHFSLNGRPYYLRGICEHCYFPDTVHPNHDKKYYRSIIKEIKKLGFNFIRFHTYVPEEEYMQAADELGMLVHIECPNNTTVSEWKEIVSFCRRHSCAVIYCCGNELQMDDDFIEYLSECADVVHKNTDAMFSPMNAMRGLEYFFVEPEQNRELVTTPFLHHPRRFRRVGEFSDMFSSYATEQHSYESLRCDPAELDARSPVYGNKPRVSHEICIDGTFADLSVKDRYKNTRIGKTEMFSSIEKHLEEKGVLEKAPLYFKNSSEWQRRVRKYCFESARRSEHIAGYDFLGPIDTHWHTFGYDVGMMNEFYELKPGETVRNVRMYNSETILLSDIGKKRNFKCGEKFGCNILCSCYSEKPIKNARLTVRLASEDKVYVRKDIEVGTVSNGCVSSLYSFSEVLPHTEKPEKLKLCVTIDGDGKFAENEWELYVFPNVGNAEKGNVYVVENICFEEFAEKLRAGADILLLDKKLFPTLETTFRIALAGRTGGNLATVVYDHPALEELPHEGFCGWQFADMLEGGSAVTFADNTVPFNPMIEVVSTHKNFIRQAAMFEFKAYEGRVVFCGLEMRDSDPASVWLKESILKYMQSDNFSPEDTFTEEALLALKSGKAERYLENTNLAANPNDITSKRKSKKQK